MADSEFAVPLGRRNSDKVLVGVTEVPNGVDCDCVCPVCGDDLIARQGKIVAWHFAHRVKAGGHRACGEGSLHLLAKEALAGLSEVGHPIWLAIGPELVIRKLRQPDMEHELKEFESRLRPDVWALADISVEWVPDTTLMTQWCALEIAVTHFKDNKYRSELWNKGAPAYELVVNEEAWRWHALNRYRRDLLTTMQDFLQEQTLKPLTTRPHTLIARRACGCYRERQPEAGAAMMHVRVKSGLLEYPTDPEPALLAPYADAVADYCDDCAELLAAQRAAEAEREAAEQAERRERERRRGRPLNREHHDIHDKQLAGVEAALSAGKPWQAESLLMLIAIGSDGWTPALRRRCEQAWQRTRDDQRDIYNF